MPTKFICKRWSEREPIARSLPYALREPDGGADRAAPRPLVLYLHGAGGKGDDPDMLLSAGLPGWLRESSAPFPFWLLAPQSPSERSGWPVDAVAALLRDVVREHAVDADRICLIGASMGGRGVYELAYDYGEHFAAAVPLCAFGIPTLAPRLAKLPLWAFHGALDDIVPLAHGQAMADALKAAGCPCRFTVLQGHGHSIERQVYAMPELWTWVAEQKRSGPAEPAKLPNSSFAAEDRKL